MRFFALLFLFSGLPASAAPLCEIPDNSANLNSVPNGVAIDRVQVRCDGQGWSLQAVQFGIPWFELGRIPSAGRVIRFGPVGRIGQRVRVAAWNQGHLREGWIDSAAFRTNPGCLAKSNVQMSLQAFLEEADLAISLSGHTPDNPLLVRFSSLVREQRKKLNELKRIVHKNPDESERIFAEVGLEIRKVLSLSEKDRVKRLRNLTALLFSVLNPSSPTPAIRSTLAVPLSRAWFESSPELAVYYRHQFLSSDFDAKFTGGGSGEGIVGVPLNDHAEFDRYLGKLRALSDFIRVRGSSAIRASSEAAWLKEETALNFFGVNRLIFIHPPTWKESSLGEEPWADYIPIDQSIGGLPSSRLFSVLMHEVNVNGYDFMLFPNDTHMPKEKTYFLWNCVARHGVHSLSPDGLNVSAFLGLQPWMSLVYVAIELRLFEAEFNASSLK